MKLIPYFLTKRPLKGLEAIRLTLFLSHAGKSIWKTDESGLLSEQEIRDLYVDPNGFVVKSIWTDTQTQTAWICVDETKTHLSEFYSWEEALASSQKPECWRHLYWMRDAKGCHWWSPKGIPSTELMEVGSFDTVLETVERFERS